MATGWDGEIAGLQQGIKAVTIKKKKKKKKGIKAVRNREWDIILLTDSKVAIQATNNVGIRGKARIKALALLGTEINKRQARYSRENVKI